MNSQKTVRSDVTGVLQEYSPVVAEKIYTPEDSAANGVATTRYRVQLRQTVKSIYPAARGNALYEGVEIGEGRAGQEFVEQRVCFLTVPPSATLTLIQERLNQMEGPKLVRVLTLAPALSEDQLRTIENGRNPKSYEDYLEDFVPGLNGAPILFKGEKQYRKIQFSRVWVEDVDNRAIDYQGMKGKAVQLARSSEAAHVPARI